MLRDVGVATVLVGHSERRHVIGEADALVARKLRAALSGGLSATLCIGETLEQREAGQTDAVNRRQLETALEGIAPEEMASVVIAYEPVWAIGTGRTAGPDQAQAAHEAVRTTLAERYDVRLAGSIRIQYGGSVKPANAADLMAMPDVDGFLVGGASLEAGSFLAIVEAAIS
jgi:triosephosphate isomerase